MAQNESDTPKKEPSNFYEWSRAFLDELAQVPNVSRAARKVGIGRKTAYRHRETNAAFAAAWDDAIETGVDRLEEEMWRRAVEGTDKPVTYEGRITATYKDYSDTLAIVLAKAHRPEKFRERHEISGNPDNPIQHVAKIDVSDFTTDQLEAVIRAASQPTGDRGTEGTGTA